MFYLRQNDCPLCCWSKKYILLSVLSGSTSSRPTIIRSMTSELINSIVPILTIGLIGLIIGSLIGALLVVAFQKPGTSRDVLALKTGRTLLRIWRDSKNNQLVLEMEEKTFSSFEKMSPQMRSKLEMILIELKNWAFLSTDPYPNLSMDPFQNPQADRYSPKFNLIQPIRSSQFSKSIYSNEVDFGELIPKSKGQEKLDQKQEIQISIAAQIDHILQNKLRLSPLRNHSMKIIESPDGGIAVIVDDKSYESVHDVADFNFKKLIQESVAEWEQKK